MTLNGPQQLSESTLEENSIVKNEKHGDNNVSLTNSHGKTLKENLTNTDKRLFYKDLYDDVTEVDDIKNQRHNINYFNNINDTIVELEVHGHDGDENTNDYKETPANVNNVAPTRTTVINKEYQSLLDRFRRKNVTGNDNGNLDVNTTSIDETKMVFNNSLMEKLIDDETRSKILHDYFKTVGKGIIEEDINFNETEEANVLSEMEGDMGFYNGSLAYTDRPEGKVTSFGKMRTPRPDLLDGKSIYLCWL